MNAMRKNREKKITVAILCAVLVGLFAISSCDKLQRLRVDEIDWSMLEATPKVLMLTVDYTTNTFKGGKEFVFANNSDTFTITNEYKEPGDFGWIKLYYEEINELLFYGTIHWRGCGKMLFPKDLLDSNQFQRNQRNDYVTPKNGFEDVFPVINMVFDYELAWSAVQSLVKVREYLWSNPEQTVKMFLYTPSVGCGNPEDWYWVIYLKK